MDKTNDAATVADLAVKAAAIQSFKGEDGRTFLILPAGFSAQDVTDPHGLFPRRPAYTKQAVEVQSLDSLVEYVNAFKTDDTKLFADMKGSAIRAALDYHAADGKAANVAHNATMVLPFSEEWKIWTEANGKLMGQLEFARFIEENNPDVAKPNAAELVEIARDLHAARNVKFTKVVRTDSDNENFTMDDQTSLASKSSGSSIELPRQFTLRIPVYFGESAIDMTAFLRWKLHPEEGMLLGIKIWRLEHIRQAEFQRIVTSAAERTTLTAVFGKLV